jgi:ATP-dependent RNA helicase DeaD
VTREFGRFVRYYQDAPELEEVTRRDADEEKRKKKDRRRAQKGYTRFFINIGKKDHVQPVHIIEMLNRNVAGRVDVGRIDLMQNFSFFECPEEYTEEIIEGMSGVNYKGREVNVEVAETRSEDGEQREEKPVRERKPLKEEKPRREEKPVKEKKPNREERPKSKDKIERHTARRAPQVPMTAQDDDFWRDFENGDWRQFFRSDDGKPRRGAGRSESKPSKRKDKKPVRKEKSSARKEKVNGRKASRTVTKPRKSRR